MRAGDARGGGCKRHSRGRGNPEKNKARHYPLCSAKGARSNEVVRAEDARGGRGVNVIPADAGIQGERRWKCPSVPNLTSSLRDLQ